MNHRKSLSMLVRITAVAACLVMLLPGIKRLFRENLEENDLRWRDAVLTDYDATQEYIFLAFDDALVVDAYTWDGQYQFTLASPYAQNGVLMIQCKEGLLYISSRTDNVSVYDGKTLIQELDHKDEAYPSSWWFHEPAELVELQNDGIYSREDGQKRLTVPGEVREPWMAFLFAGLLILMYVLSWIRLEKRRSKEDTPAA